jgi:hypothetical protein
MSPLSKSDEPVAKEYPIDPKVFYNEEQERGHARINRRLIEQSKNVVEFQPFILQYVYEKYGDVDLTITYDFWVRNGYRRV